MAAVASAVGTVTSGALSGAGGEMGRRSSEALAGLVRRMRRQNATPDPDAPADPDDDTPDPGAPDLGASNSGVSDPGVSGPGGRADEPPPLPATEEERRELARALWEGSRTSPGFAREVLAWLRETGWPGTRPVPAVAPGASRPRMLPPANAAFTDRASLPEQIARELEGGGRPAGVPAVVVLVGPGGIGKTAAAVHCAHLLGERFPDGQLYIDLEGQSATTALPPSEALVRFLDRLGVPASRMPADEQRLSELYRDCAAERRMVVVLDNAHSERQVRPLLTAASESLVIITSRYRLDGLAADPGARVIKLDPLSTADSVQLLTRIVGQGATAARGPAGAGAAAVAAVARRCGGIPLALCETGARVAVREHLTWDAVERQLSERARRREQEALPMDERSSRDAVDLTTDVTYGELSPRAALLYRMLGVWPWPSVTVGAATKAVDGTEEEARALLDELAGVHLLEEVGEERYRFHDLVRRHAERRGEAEDRHADRAAAVRRVVGWYLGFAASADLRVIPGRWRLGAAYARLRPPAERGPEDGRHALAELRAERENLAAAVRAAEHHGFDDLAWQLCEAMWGLHLRLGFHEQWVDTHLKGVAAARRSAAEFGDPRAEGRILVQLAFAHMGLGRLAEAEEALLDAAAADERARHHRGQASAVEALGLLRLKQWRYPEAERSFQEAQRVLRRIGAGEDGARDVPRALALLEHHIGRALRGQGRHDEAVRRLHGALALFRALPEPDLYNEGRVYMSLGETHLQAGDPRAARVCLDAAIATMGREGAELQHADAAEMRARCAGALADPAAEAEDLRTALALYETAGDEVSVARVNARLAELARGEGL
ncbi:tetratricopeptide repeat protein [Streptomyces sparsogenes]|uniref:tetratricopeptide repeat protein n=1 Tax=Streptomyces sparsogenes TaxID=67365 RepID=UPI0033DD843A